MCSETKIDCCDSTWSPVTGCLHGCDYCYARRIAKRYEGYDARDGSITTECPLKHAELSGSLTVTRNGKTVKAAYPFGFSPTLHRYRLREPSKWQKPRNIFVCSMADLFGSWVPDGWIQEVFDACEAAPQHRYLFLTKNPQRYNELMSAGDLPERENFWYGSTRTGIDSEREHESAMTANTFLSVEPLLAPMERETLNALEMWGWVIIGAETGNRKGKVTPKHEWVEEIAEKCAASGTPLFMKDSLRDLMGADFRKEYPWEVKT